ncbi:dienelactone hydrolase, partial [Metarhizium hybridum]
MQGKPTGKLAKIDNKIDAYVAIPPKGKAHNSYGILCLPNIISIWQNSQLMADLFAEQGYVTVMLDLFNGDPVKLNNEPAGFDIMTWLNKGTDRNNPHTVPYVDPIIEAGIKYIKALGYVVRHYKSGIDVGFIAYPSFVEEDKLTAISGPLSIVTAETDSIFPPDKRHKSKEILKATKKPYQINLFSEVEHGFTIRADLKVKVQRFAREQAFLQAVAWFDNYLLED